MSIDRRLLFAALFACSGCRRTTCEERLEKAEPAEVAEVCARAFEDAHEPADALAAARAYAKIKRRDLARSLFQQALEGHQRRGDHAGAYAAAAGLVTGHWLDNNFGAALKLARIACAEAEASGDRTSRAKSLIALGNVFHGAGDAARALDAYTRAQAELAPEDRRDRARVLSYRGALLADRRQYALAEPLLEESLAIAAELAEPALMLAAEVNLADIALGRRDLDRAARHLDGAERARTIRGDSSPSLGILINRATLARYRGDAASALAALDAAAAADPPPETTWVLAHERGQLAASLDDLDGAERSFRAAIEVVEEMWRTSSPDTLEAPFFEDRWLPYQSLFSLELERRAPAAAFDVLTSAQGRMFAAALGAASADTGDPGARAELLGALAPLLARSPYAQRADSAATIAALGDRYVLDYFAGAGRMRLLVLHGGRVEATRVDVELGRLEALIDHFLANVDDPARARALGDVLLPPEVLAAAPARFYVIPDGSLSRVPFAALIAGDARLLDRYELVYAPSATGLSGSAASADRAAGPAVVLSDARSDLLHAAVETAEVAASTGAVVYTGREATIAALRSAHDASLLHLVGHSGVDGDGGYLLLADGRVDAVELLSWRIRPRLVVLPTCASAATVRRDMWGSLAAAFLAGGSEVVVASLFSVEDQAAAAFSALFYSYGGTIDPIGATARAQRALARDRPASAWSAFIAVGL